MGGISWTSADRALLARLAEQVRIRRGLAKAPPITKVVRWALRRAQRQLRRERREG